LFHFISSPNHTGVKNFNARIKILIIQTGSKGGHIAALGKPTGTAAQTNQTTFPNLFFVTNFLVRLIIGAQV
jgi:hypothetical protein